MPVLTLTAMTSDLVDRRKQRTERAIFDAFRSLVMSQPYDEIRVADIVAAAGIGRSTFYEHYRNKEDVLTRSITWPFEALADAAVGRPDPARLSFVIDHFYEQRRLSRALFRDRPLRLLVDRLATLICERRPDPLRAHGAAAAQLEILSCWLGGRLHAERQDVIQALSHLLAD